ncbi:unnamed protein product [Durusdinium trenchii]|uniref:Uncharacterized protein n=2 Tax=Durusdinium trenchii TaxID=1381693 RepID=A0ABP0JTR6_9DINO
MANSPPVVNLTGNLWLTRQEESDVCRALAQANQGLPYRWELARIHTAPITSAFHSKKIGKFGKNMPPADWENEPEPSHEPSPSLDSACPSTFGRKDQVRRPKGMIGPRAASKLPLEAFSKAPRNGSDMQDGNGSKVPDEGPISEGLHKHKSPKGGTGSSADPPSPEQPEGPPLKAAKKDVSSKPGKGSKDAMPETEGDGGVGSAEMNHLESLISQLTEEQQEQINEEFGSEDMVIDIDGMLPERREELHQRMEEMLGIPQRDRNQREHTSPPSPPGS